MKASGDVVSGRKFGRRDTTEDIVFNIVTTAIVVLACLAVLYPLYFILIASVSDPFLVLSGKAAFLPRGVDFGGYQRIFNYDQLWTGYRNSFFYSIAGAILSTLITLLSDGGLIPTYILVKSLGLRDTFLALLLVKSVHVFNIFIAVSYFRSSEITWLYEASVMDGCTHFGYLFRVLLPISRPIVIVMLLFYGVFQWTT